MTHSPSKFDPRGPLVPRGKARKPLSEMLSKYVVRPTGCWEWTATRNKQGYGVVGLYMNGAPRGVPAPRLQWMHCFGPVADGCVILHTCDNPPCINPNHLLAGTQAANLNDMRRKGR